MKIILIICLYIFNLYAINLGNIATGSKDGMYYKQALDLQDILNEYNITLTPQVTEGSFDNLDILNGNFLQHKNTFFAIVQKDAINYYHYLQKATDNEGILLRMPVIISLGIEDLHIFINERSNFDFKNDKEYNVYCGKGGSGSCITAKYIEQAYGFKFTYVKMKKENMFKELQDNQIDIIIQVIQKPASAFRDIEGVKLATLPANLIMKRTYTKSPITSNDYSWIKEDGEIYSVAKVLITNLDDEKYNPIISNIVKILILNKEKLKNNYNNRWKDLNFEYIEYKNLSPISEELITRYLLQQQE